MEHPDQIVQKAIVLSLKKEFLQISWWSEVQDDVKNRLDWMSDNVIEIGSLFLRTFMALFRWEYDLRQMENKPAVNPMSTYYSTILGLHISEDAYQCGILPTRSILGLYDYTRPNNADVAACLMFCHKIEVLERSGLLEVDEMKLKTSCGEMAKILRMKNSSKEESTE